MIYNRAEQRSYCHTTVCSHPTSGSTEEQEQSISKVQACLREQSRGRERKRYQCATSRPADGNAEQRKASVNRAGAARLEQGTDAAG